MGGALLIAAIFEASGALIAGGDVVSTISKGIINPDAIPTAKAFILAMMAALLAAALWINLATWVGAPVSTTHSIVGGVLGAGVATAGLMTVNWPAMGGIAAAWIISPLMGGVFAALFLVIIKFMVLYRRHKVKAAITWVPILVGIMATAFSVYLAIKGFKKIWKPDLIELIALGIGSFVVAFFATKPLIKRASVKIGNTKKEVNALFKIPMIFAAALLSFLVIIKFMVLYRRHKVKAAITWVPILVGIMATAFSVYLAIKGFKKIWKPDLIELIALGIGSFVVAFFATKPLIKRASVKIGNTKKEVNALFKIPMIFAAALLSFAHGANDVANAVGPLAAIVSTVSTEGISATVGIPLWVMLIGGVGLSVGLLLYGPKLVKTVGSEITKLNPSRAFSVALSAAITVIIASWLGLPVSSTHTAVGGVFGVGFLREFLGNRRVHMMGSFFHHETGKKTPIMQKINSRIASLEARKLVRRRYLYTICAAWIITVPVSALLSGLLVFGLTYIAG